MSEIVRIANSLRKLNRLLVRSGLSLQQNPDHRRLAITIQGLESAKVSLENRFQAIASRSWIDVCSYRLRSEEGSFIPLNGFAGTLLSFQNSLSQTMDSLTRGIPRRTQHLSQDVAVESSLKFGYTQVGDTVGELDLALLIENRREVIDRLGDSVREVFSIANCKDTELMHGFSQKLGAAPIRAIAEWTASQIESKASTEVCWTRDARQIGSLRKSLADWQELKSIIELVSDVKTEGLEIEGILVAANVVTKAFAVETSGETISGKFRDGLISSTRSAQLPWRYKFILEKTTTENFATNRVTTRYKMIDLKDLGRASDSSSLS